MAGLVQLKVELGFSAHEAILPWEPRFLPVSLLVCLGLPSATWLSRGLLGLHFQREAMFELLQWQWGTLSPLTPTFAFRNYPPDPLGCWNLSSPDLLLLWD